MASKYIDAVSCQAIQENLKTIRRVREGLALLSTGASMAGNDKVVLELDEMVEALDVSSAEIDKYTSSLFESITQKAVAEWQDYGSKS